MSTTHTHTQTHICFGSCVNVWNACVRFSFSILTADISFVFSLKVAFFSHFAIQGTVVFVSYANPLVLRAFYESSEVDLAGEKGVCLPLQNNATCSQTNILEVMSPISMPFVPRTVCFGLNCSVSYKPQRENDADVSTLRPLQCICIGLCFEQVK